jgi:toxin ParE1/3/4
LAIFWPPLADRTRDAQIDFIAKDDPFAASRLDTEIERQVDMFIMHPSMGRQQGTRELVISRTPYIAVYRVIANRIEIIRILHNAQQRPRARR